MAQQAPRPELLSLSPVLNERAKATGGAMTEDGLPAVQKQASGAWLIVVVLMSGTEKARSVLVNSHLLVNLHLSLPLPCGGGCSVCAVCASFSTKTQ